MEADRVYAESEALQVPIVRFYTWKKATLSFGVNQNPLRRLNLRRCFADGVEVVARPTGGREILHGWDLCCSVIWPTKRAVTGVDFRSLFDRINEILKSGLKRMGIDGRRHEVSRKPIIQDGPCFSQIDRGEISARGKKIIASAQRIYRNSVLQQSSISLARPERNIADYLQYGSKSEISEKIVNSAAYLEEILAETSSLREIVEIFREAFESELGACGVLLPPGGIGKTIWQITKD
jgi:lipoate-protein ligase A